MPMDTISFRTTPGDWGIFKVMERIDAITKRFGPHMAPPAQQDFKTELTSQLYQPGVDQVQNEFGGPAAAAAAAGAHNLAPAATLPASLPQDYPFVEKMPRIAPAPQAAPNPYKSSSQAQPFDELFGGSTPIRQEISQQIQSAGGNADIDAIIADAARKHNLDEGLLRAVITAESNYNPKATSPKGAMGLMQLMPGTARDLGVTNAYDPAQNVDGGARYLRQMLDQFGTVENALAAYNAGPGAVATYNGVPPYAETQNYVNKIMKMLGGS